MTQPVKKQKLDRPFDTQCLQYWQLSKMVRLGINPSTNDPLGQTPQQILAFTNKWLDLLAWRTPLHGRILALKDILERDIKDHDEQERKTNS